MNYTPTFWITTAKCKMNSLTFSKSLVLYIKAHKGHSALQVGS